MADKLVIDANGVHTEPLTPEEVIEESNKEAQKTAARVRLEKLESQRGALIEAREIDGEMWFLKRLSWPQLTEVSLQCPRDRNGILQMQSSNNLRSVTIALLIGAVATGEADETPYFNRIDAEGFVDEPAAVGLIARLFNTITDINPDLLPKKTKNQPSLPASPSEPPAG